MRLRTSAAALPRLHTPRRAPLHRRFYGCRHVIAFDLASIFAMLMLRLMLTWHAAVIYCRHFARRYVAFAAAPPF